jgi:ATP-binding cassette subfamily F protein uup
MPLVTLLDVGQSYGGPTLLEHVNLQIDAGERVCLLGRNGAGKSTLMKILAGEVHPDTGNVFPQAGVRITRLGQEVPRDLSGNVRDRVVAAAEAGADSGPHEEDWERDIRVDRLLERMQLPENADCSSLSGGMKRRVLLAEALAGRPDLLLLDEPTNHLDIPSIRWLESFLIEEKLSIFFVTHDRAFLRRLATRILELDRGTLTSWACDYDTFLVRKQAFLEEEEKQRAAFDKKLAQEEIWIRKGMRAQRTRALARIKALEEMRAERRARRERLGIANIQLTEATRSGTMVIETENLSFAWPDGKLLVRNLTTTILRGDKIGIVGPNGAGKTTLVRLLLGDLAPTSGTIKHGTKLEIVYLDQLRAQIEDDKTVAENINGGADTIQIDGRSRHVITYLQDFLFEPSRSRTPARVLSGGERNRLLLARLFTKPANVLVLDEPTNDLDLETLELLENLLVDYQGTLILVSHDRQFLDEVVTSTFVLEGDGVVSENIGGYSDWESSRNQRVATPPTAQKSASKPAVQKEPAARPLSAKERRELQEIPARIEKLEAKQQALAADLADPATYRDPDAAQSLRLRLDALEKEHATLFARWEDLESRYS